MKKTVTIIALALIFSGGIFQTSLAHANQIGTSKTKNVLYHKTSSNLILNGDFSQGSDGWDANVSTDQENALIHNSLGVTATTQSISVEKNSKYRLTFDLRNNAPSQLDCEVAASLGNLTQTYNAVVNDYNTWETFNFDISSYDSTSLTIKFSAVNSLATGSLDNVKLVKIS